MGEVLLRKRGRGRGGCRIVGECDCEGDMRV